MAGLTAASSLTRAGFTTLVIDKSLKVGGRLASKKIGPARFDYGAQFMTAREPQFLSLLEECERAGLVKIWFSSQAGAKPVHPRWCGVSKMTAVAGHLASTIPLCPGLRLASVELSDGRWLARMISGEAILAKAVVLTPPVPQILDLLRSSEIHLSTAIADRLDHIEYEKCVAVLAVLTGSSQIDPPGGKKFPQGPISWLADNSLKGISEVPAVTIHGSPRFSHEHWLVDRRESGMMLLEAAERWIGDAISEFQVHGWRYAKPLRIDPERFMVIQSNPPLVLAGDAFGGPRVEGAAMSGWKAAETLSKMLVS